MKGLETIWDIDDRGGQSTVQKFGNKCIKLYPLASARKDYVTRQKLERYHKFQGSLQAAEIEIGEDDTYLQKLGFKKILLSFVDLSGINILEGSDIRSRRKLLITEIPFIEGVSVKDLSYAYELKVTISRYILLNMKLSNVININNLKLISDNAGILQVVCTDVFWNIPVQVNSLLELA